MNTIQAAAAPASDTRFARFLAQRFVRARRQGLLSVISLVSALGFTVGVASLIVVLALMTGFQEDLISKIVGSNAHVIVDPANGLSSFEDSEALLARVESVPGVAAAEANVQGFGGAIGPSGIPQWTLVTGVDPARAGRVTSLESAMVWGQIDALAKETASGRPGIVLGEVLARRLGVLPGDTIRLMVPRPRLTPWGPSIQQPSFEVVGTFSLGYIEYDESWSIVDLDQGREIFGVEGAHRINARVADLSAVERVKDAIQAALGEEYRVTSVLEYNRTLFSALELEKVLMTCAIGLIVIVAALGVVSTLVLTVMQKVREIGVLMALGASRGGVLRVFVYQGLAMGLVGTFAGGILGVGLCFALDRFELIPLDPEVYYLSHLPFRVLVSDVAIVVGASIAVALVATVYPAWRASSLDPVEALRHE